MTAPLIAILAGGEGRRIGGGKPLRRLGGERLIDRAVRLAGRWSDDVRIVLRSAGQLADMDAPVLIDAEGIDGPLAGLAAALEAGRAEGREKVLTIPCDVPFLPDDLAQKLEAAIGDLLVAIAADDQGLHPSCALWRVEALDPLPDYLATGRRSLIGFAERLGFASARWEAGHFLNVNTYEDLAAAERRLASEVEHLDQIAGGEAGAAGTQPDQ